MIENSIEERSLQLVGVPKETFSGNNKLWKLSRNHWTYVISTDIKFEAYNLFISFYFVVLGFWDLKL